MKTTNLIRLILSVALLALCSFTVTACSTPPSERVVQVQSLKAVGQAAEAAVVLSAQLYRDNKINDRQARDVMEIYNLKFQPIYREAVKAAQANLDSIASPELASLAAQLSSLVLSFQPHS